MLSTTDWTQHMTNTKQKNETFLLCNPVSLEQTIKNKITYYYYEEFLNVGFQRLLFSNKRHTKHDFHINLRF